MPEKDKVTTINIARTIINSNCLMATTGDNSPLTLLAFLVSPRISYVTAHTTLGINDV